MPVWPGLGSSLSAACVPSPQHPYTGTHGLWVDRRVFIVALTDIEAGQELLVSYGQGYHDIHFTSDDVL